MTTTCRQRVSDFWKRMDLQYTLGLTETIEWSHRCNQFIERNNDIISIVEENKIKLSQGEFSSVLNIYSDAEDQMLSLLSDRWYRLQYQMSRFRCYQILVASISLIFEIWKQ